MDQIRLKDKLSQFKIDDVDAWFSMIADRNLSVHTDDKKIAKQIFLRIKKYYLEFHELAK